MMADAREAKATLSDWLAVAGAIIGAFTAILDIQIAELDKRLAEKGISIQLKPKAREFMVDHGYDPSMGARPMRRLIQREIEDQLSEKILAAFNDPEEAQTGHEHHPKPSDHPQKAIAARAGRPYSSERSARPSAALPATGYQSAFAHSISRGRFTR